MKPFLFMTVLSLFVTGISAATDQPDATPKTYPLTTCVVSGEPLGSMGQPVEVIHQEEGKPDRRVLLCCRGCISSFRSEPARYLAKLDAAEKAADETPKE